MCGIAGILGASDAYARVKSMTSALAHRGPDDFGVSTLSGSDGRLVGAFGHRRLAIIDPSPSGHQPMFSPHERFAISYNGELFNYKQLRARLQDQGVQLRSGSDTEVLLAGLAIEGPSFLARTDGMFAFALWDRERNLGWLARD